MESWRSALNEQDPTKNNKQRRRRALRKQADGICVKLSVQKWFRPRVTTRLNGKCQLGPRGTVMKQIRTRGLLACYFINVIVIVIIIITLYRTHFFFMGMGMAHYFLTT